MKTTELIIFDLDGVLVEAKEIHYEALNNALGEKYAIDWDEHLSKYDGLKTKQKLELLTKNKGLPASEHIRVWEEKQIETIKKLEGISPSDQLTSLFEQLSSRGYKIAVCSNSIRKTVFTVLQKLGLVQYIDLILSNEDVLNSKPHPEIFWTAMSKLSIDPEKTLIVEDSPHGLLAAARTKASVLRVNNPSDLNITLMNDTISKVNKGYSIISPKWVDEELNVLIPMAGAGSRFSNAGYTFPKPLIEVKGKPMIQVVVENLNIKANYIFIVQKKHREQYNLETLLKLITSNCTVIETDGLTEGAACTALLAKNVINDDKPLFFANSDQFVEWDSNEFFYKMNETKCDGGIVTFNATHPKWSYAKVNEKGLVTQVEEKNPISNLATVGFYFWKKGSDFVKYAEQMIEKNIRVNNEFYVCPVYNQAIEDGLKIRTFAAEKMWGIGTPEDLNTFLNNFDL